ncbi:DUF4957 domain-containing protein [Flavobacterium sp.]|uniref:DUF4957 domain-containing protein n=1 Tax=Flavobacterium sp. TaxID=239 RepID=UPI002BAD3CC4|nr:DUF4957 domain-containing protein [Flavobacterium sp.]HSD06595.1 DUF4957 domain-containing protein [Flavobacterium sp.]
MKIKHILKGLIATLLLVLAFSSCDSFNEPLLDELGNTREFSPIGLTAKVRNQTTVELNWTTRESTEKYIVEFSADDPEFTTIEKTIEVTASQLPIQVALAGETVYSIRVKAIASGLEESKWSVVTATTLSEQIFYAVAPEEILAKQVTLRWPANSVVTQIVVTPGDITHVITAEEKAAGFATVTGLTPETSYTATLFNNTKVRGTKTFTSGIDIGNGILVKTTDDLMQMIAEANSGATLVLEPGSYTATNQIGTITLAKSITLRGLRSYSKPKLNVRFVLNSGTANLSLIDLDLDGTGLKDASAITYNEESATYDALLISGCKIHDYAKSFITAAALKLAKINSILVENSVVTNILTASSDCIDFRGSYVGQLTLKNSTFNNTTVRDFIRMDNTAGTLSGTGLTNNVLIDACTINNPSMPITGRILYVRFASNVIDVKNTLFSNIGGIFSKEATTSTPTFKNNNYFNSPNLQTKGASAGTIFDTAGTALNPQFTDAANGIFTIGNQALKDNNIGDPLWRQ